MIGQYSYPAQFYDALQSDVDYGAYCEFAIEMCGRFGFEPTTALDLACGTGAIALEMAKRGLDVTAVDMSDEMLCAAREKIAETKYDILLLCQDMRELDLNDTVDMAVCALDSMNYLPDTKSLKAALEKVRLFLTPGGVFVFDMNTRYKFENIYGDRDYVLEVEGLLCAWQNHFDRKRGVCDFVLTFFEEQEDGSYERYDECQRERCYSEKTVRRLAQEAGLEICGEYSDFDGSSVGEKTERVYYVLRKPN